VLISTFLQISFSGIATGAIFALAAVGFALLWQTAGAINFAHGEFIALPAIVMLVLGEDRPTLGLPDWVPLAGGTPIGGPLPEIGIVAAFVVTVPLAVLVLGYVFKVSLVDRLLTPGGDDIPLVIASLGLALTLREYLRIQFGARPEQFPSTFGTARWRPGGIPVSADDVGVLVVSIVVILALQLFLRRTFTGRQMEAVAQNPDTARVLGIPVGRMVGYTFAINAVLVTVAALLVAPTTHARWDAGLSLGLVAFTAAIIGGFNQVRGALFGGFAVGLLQNWSGYYLSSAYREAIPLLLMILVILWRPQGLFGTPEERRI
jgi:branched-chain amino acid transport system permease protein